MFFVVRIYIPAVLSVIRDMLLCSLLSESHVDFRIQLFDIKLVVKNIWIEIFSVLYIYNTYLNKGDINTINLYFKLSFFGLIVYLLIYGIVVFSLFLTLSYLSINFVSYNFNFNSTLLLLLMYVTFKLQMSVSSILFSFYKLFLMRTYL